MVNALIQISPETNQTLNTIKVAYDLKDKSAAIEFIVNEYIKDLNSISEVYDYSAKRFKPEFIKTSLAIGRAYKQGKFVEYGGLKGFNEHFDSLRAAAIAKAAQATAKTNKKGSRSTSRRTEKNK